MDIPSFLISCTLGGMLALSISVVSMLRLSRQKRELLDREARLRGELKSIEHQHALITTNIAAAVIIRENSGEILFSSPYTEVLTGYPLAEISLHNDFLESICFEEDRARYLRARQVCELGEDSLVRYRVQHRSGMPLWLETRMVPVLNGNGDVASILSVTIDVTASVNYQCEIEEKNRDLSDFAYMVSHDLKAPIFTIQGMVNALREDHAKALGRDGAELLRYMADAANRLEQLANSVIEYSKVSANTGLVENIALNVVLRDVLRDQAPLIRNSGATIDIDPKLPTVRGEPIRIYQVFANLVNNALKYRRPERPLHVTIRQVPLPTRTGRPEFAAIEVSDNGLGVPSAKLEDIFRPYQRGRTQLPSGETIEGNGIGLACVKKIIERIGGSITVTSREGEGSTFRVLLPVAEPEPQSIPRELTRCYQL